MGNVNETHNYHPNTSLVGDIDAVADKVTAENVVDVLKATSSARVAVLEAEAAADAARVKASAEAFCMVLSASVAALQPAAMLWAEVEKTKASAKAEAASARVEAARIKAEAQHKRAEVHTAAEVLRERIRAGTESPPPPSNGAGKAIRR